MPLSRNPGQNVNTVQNTTPVITQTNSFKNKTISFDSIISNFENSGDFGLKSKALMLTKIKGILESKNLQEVNNILVNLSNTTQFIEIDKYIEELSNIASRYEEEIKEAVKNAQELQDKEKLKQKLEEFKKQQQKSIEAIKNQIEYLINNIDNFTFPGKITFLGRDIYFNDKKQAITALNKINKNIEQINDKNSSLLEFIWDKLLSWNIGKLGEFNIYLFNELILSQGKDTIDKLGDFKFSTDLEDIKDDLLIFGDIAVFDFIAIILGAYLIGNIDTAIITAISESGGRLIKGRAGAYGGIGVMEDYSNRTDLSTTDIEGEKAQEFYEVKQRENLLRGIEIKIESISDHKLKAKLKEDLKTLERYKLVKGDEFYFKAYLIGKKIGLKNFKSGEYYLVRLMSIANGARFVVPGGYDWVKGEGIKNLKFWKKINWINFTKEGVSFTKIQFTPELERLIKKANEKVEEGLKQYFTGVEVDYNKDKKLTEIKYNNDSKFTKNVEYIFDYIDSLELSDSEKKRRKENIEEYLNHIKDKKIFISAEEIGENISKFAEEGKYSLKEIKKVITEDSYFEKFLEDSKIDKYFTEGEKSFLINKDKKRFVKFFEMLSNGEIEVNDENIDNILNDFKAGKELKEISLNSRNINTIIEDGKIITESKTKVPDKFKYGTGKNLFSLINLDKVRFNENFEPIFESIYKAMEARADKYTLKELELDLAKIYKGYLPNFVILDIFKNGNISKYKLRKYINLNGLDLESKEVKDFIEKVEKGEWHGTIEELKGEIEQLKKGRIVQGKKFNENVEDIIKNIEQEGAEFEEKSFRRSKYDIPFKDGKIDKEEFKVKEFELAKLYHKLNGGDLSEEKFDKLFEYILDNNGDYTGPDFFKKLNESLGLHGILNIDDNNINRSNFIEKISKVIEPKISDLEKVLKDNSKTSEEKKAAIEDFEKKTGKTLDDFIKEYKWILERHKGVLKDSIGRLESVYSSFKETLGDSVKIEDLRNSLEIIRDNIKKKGDSYYKQFQQIIKENSVLILNNSELQALQDEIENKINISSASARTSPETQEKISSSDRKKINNLYERAIKLAELKGNLKLAKKLYKEKIKFSKQLRNPQIKELNIDIKELKGALEIYLGEKIISMKKVNERIELEKNNFLQELANRGLILANPDGTFSFKGTESELDIELRKQGKFHFGKYIKKAIKTL